MSEEDKREEKIFDAAIEIANRAERDAYLTEACGPDQQLRAKVEALLRHHEKGGIIDKPPFEAGVTLDDTPLTEGPGTVIGRYKLLQQIGEGGFGVVYMAEQQEPIRRKVALKIIKLGMDTKQVIARFEAERQALALMDHPNIAKVFDAGATETGRPYFVMELVKGIPITEYCDKNKLDTQQRLELFIDICKAVQHAHQKGIIHRDIKPSNVLVTLHDGTPVPKVIDFGIAKATQQRLTEKTLFTEFKQFLGTPEYMSPEQAEMSGLDVDTRTDIYSLGVLLYELLTGTTPFGDKELRSAGFDEIRRIIREDEPPKPSTCLSTLGDSLDEVAKHRKSIPSQLCKTVRGELDWIVMMTLEKDRTRRYETANELARDIKRHLGNEPVVAGPPSTVYRLRKFVRRNRALVTAVSAVAATIIVGLVVSTAMYFQAEKARDKEAVARGFAEEARGVAEEAQTAEAKQRQIAEQEANRAKEEAEAHRRTLYVTHFSMAKEAYSQRNIRRVREMLELCSEDLRGWEWYRLRHIADQSHMTLAGHGDEVWSAAFSPDGKRIVSCSDDGTIKVWDAATGAELMTFRHDGEVWSAAFSQDGERIVSGGSDGRIKVWDAITGAKLMTLRGHEYGVEDAVFSPDSKRIISGSHDKTIRVWDAATGAELMTLRGHNAAVYSVVFSPDGKRIVSGSIDKTIKVWDAATGAELMTLVGHGDEVWSVVFSPDGKHIVSGSVDNTIKVWDAATGAELMTLRGHDEEVYSVVFSPDGKRIVSGSVDNTIKVWDAKTGDEMMTLVGHSGTVNWLAFSPDGERIVSGGSDGTIKVWDTTIDRELTTLRGHGDNVWSKVWSVAFSPDGKRIVSGSVDNTIKVWDAATGAELMTLRGHVAAVYSAAFSPDGKRIVSCGEGKTIRVWDVETKSELMTLRGHEHRIWAIMFSPDGKRIVSGSDDKTVKVWDAATGGELMTLRGHGKGVHSAAFSPDGKCVVSGSFDHTIKVWDAATGDELMTLRGHDKQVYSVVFSPDGKRIISGSNDKTIKVWDAATGAELMTLRGHAKEVWSVVFSPDGKRIVSCSSAGTIKVWDAASGAELMTLVGHGDEFWSVAFSPDGKTIAAGGYEGSIKLWESTAPAGGYEPRRTANAAREVVDELYEKHDFYSEVIDKLKADKMLDEPLREVALQIANARLWEDAKKLEIERIKLASLYINEGRYDEAKTLFVKVVELNPDNAYNSLQLALLQLYTGDIEGYRKTCAGMLDHFGRTERLENTNRVAWTCSLAPDAIADLTHAVRLAERGLESGDKNGHAPTRLGAILYRAGRFDEAVRQLSKLTTAWDQGKELPTATSPAYTWFFMAMAHHQLGRHEEAKKWLAKAAERAEQEIADHPSWFRQLTLELFGAEAKLLLGVSGQ